MICLVKNVNNNFLQSRNLLITSATCLHCQTTFSTYQRLKSHKCSKEELLKCNTCSKLYKSKRGLANHLCRVCSICSKVFPSFKSLGIHICRLPVHNNNDILKQPNMSDLLQVCNIEAETTGKSEEKRKKHTDDVEAREENKRRKINLEKENAVRRHPCKLCKREFTTENLLHKHRCSYCMKCHIVFSSYQKYSTHKCCLKRNIPQNSDGKEVHLQSRNVTLSKVRTFKPVDENWQKAQCDMLSLHYITIAYTNNTSDSQNLNTTQPATVKQIIGDGNCFLGHYLYMYHMQNIFGKE